MANKITKIPKKSKQNYSYKWAWTGKKPKEKYTSPEERENIINDLRLI